MKTLITTLLTICLFTSTSFAQSSCSKYYPFKEGAKFTYTHYDKKGKQSGEMDFTVTNVRKEGDYEAMTMTAAMKDKKGNDTMDFAYDITCDGSGVSIDYNSLGNMGMLQKFENVFIIATQDICCFNGDTTVL